MMPSSTPCRSGGVFQGIPRVSRVTFSQGGYPAENPMLARVCVHLGYPGYPFSIKEKKGVKSAEGTMHTPCGGKKGKDGKSDTLDTLCTLSVQSPAQRRATHRADRRLSTRTAQVAVWWSKLPKPRPTYLRPTTLEKSLGMTLRRAAASLRWLGWQRITRRIHGKPATIWLPPASPLKPRPPGGTRIYPCD